jgi:hypothetical protein
MAIIVGMSFSALLSARTLRRARLASLLAAAASLLALAGTATASAAPLTPAPGAAGARTAAPAGGLLLSHVCRVLGSDGTTQAVHCADLFSLGHGSAVGQNEVYCQNIASRAVVQCKGIVQSVELAVGEGGRKPVFTRSEQGICGAAFQDPACGTRRVVSQTAPTPAGRVACAVWAVSGDGSTSNGGGGFPDAVVLPSGRGVAGPDIATPHRLVSSCPPR